MAVQNNTSDEKKLYRLAEKDMSVFSVEVN
jgi:hypothetical protein